jgi:hypothetical protein
MRKADIIVGILFIGLSIYAGFLSFDLELGDFSSPEAGFLPFTVSVLLFLFSCLLLVVSLRGERKDQVGERAGGKRPLGMVLFFFSLSAAFLVALALIGFWIDTFILLAVLYRMAGGRSLGRSLLFSTLSVISCYVLFVVFLKCEFPNGMLVQDVIWKFFPTF